MKCEPQMAQITADKCKSFRASFKGDIPTAADAYRSICAPGSRRDGSAVFPPIGSVSICVIGGFPSSGCGFHFPRTNYGCKRFSISIRLCSTLITSTSLTVSFIR